jgi:hypothetical protein
MNKNLELNLEDKRNLRLGVVKKLLKKAIKNEKFTIISFLVIIMIIQIFNILYFFINKII